MGNREIIQGLRERAPSAVEELISRYAKRIEHFLRRRGVAENELGRCGGDIFQTVSDAVAWNPQLDPESLAGFVCGIARRWFAVYRARAGARAAAIAKSVLTALPERDRAVLVDYYLGEAPERICRNFQLTDTQLRVVKARAAALFGKTRRRPPAWTAGTEMEKIVA